MPLEEGSAPGTRVCPATAAPPALLPVLPPTLGSPEGKPACMHSVLLTYLLPRGTVTFYFYVTPLQLIAACILSPRSRDQSWPGQKPQQQSLPV